MIEVSIQEFRREISLNETSYLHKFLVLLKKIMTILIISRIIKFEKYIKIYSKFTNIKIIEFTLEC